MGWNCSDGFGGVESVGVLRLRLATRQRSSAQDDGSFCHGEGDSAATAADGLAGEQELGEDAVQFGLPAEFFFAGQLGEVGESLLDRGVVGAELGEKFVADLVAGKGGVGIRGVFAPGLIGLVEEGFDIGSVCVEEGAKDLSFCESDDWVDGA